MSDWLIRPAVREDEAAIASMWLRQLCATQDAAAAGFKLARKSGSEEQQAYWQQQQPIVTGLVRSALVNVRVACDPERADHAKEPAVIWGWSVTAGDIVYGAGIKRRWMQELPELARDMARDLLGDTLERPMRTVLDLGDLSRLKMIPASWKRERGWASSLRQAVERVIARDEVHVSVMRHVVDETRAQWAPGTRRAA